MNDACTPPGLAFLAGGGDTGALMRGHDWSASPLGPPCDWPVPLRTVASILLAANLPMFAAWGPERAMIYNDGYAGILGAKHPAALGRPFFEVWHELVDSVGPIMDRAYAGEPSAMDDLPLRMLRHGYEEDAHFSYFYAPLRDEGGTVRGVYCACQDVTARVHAQRRTALRHALDERLRGLADADEVMEAAADALGGHLGVARVGYAEVEGGWAAVGREWNPAGLPTLVGRHRLDDYGAVRIAEMRAGRTDVIADFAADPRLGPPDVAIHRRLGIGAQVVVPLVKHGALVALLFVHAAAPRRWLPDEVAAVEDAAERTWAAVARARADAALRESEARHRRMLEIDTVGVVFFDMVGGITGANDAFLRLIGYSRAELEAGAVRYENLTPPDWAWRDERTIAELRMTGGSGPFEKEYFRRDGSRMWILCASKMLDARTAVEFVIDVTERRRAEARLRELNQTLERQVAERTAERDRMWQISPDLMLVIDFDGYFRRVNPAWTALLGYGSEELVGHHVNEFVLPDDHAATVAAYELAAAGGRPRIVNRYRHKDGSTRWISWVAAPEGGMTYATGRDVTREKEREAELARTQEALRQSQKMEAVGQLTGGIAHDFNNMLQAVGGGLDLARRRIAAGRADEALNFLAASREGVGRAATLTRRLLAFARRQPLDARPVELDALVRGMAELLERTVGPQVKLELRMGDGDFPVLCDANQMESALLNLGINARDAMPAGGRLTIATRDVRLGPADLVGEEDTQPGDFVEVAVSDSGEGMPPEVMARAFEPFFTTKPIGRGTGLGLSQVYGFVRQSRGLVRLESEAGRGTTVRLLLPRHAGAAAAAGQPEAARTGADADRCAAGGTVLLVEDEGAVRAQASEALREAGWEVAEAGDAAAALAALRAGLAPDLLVTDVGLPGGLNGRQLAEAVREARPGLPVLLITGYAGAALAEALPEGMAVIGKPFALGELVGAVRWALGHPTASGGEAGAEAAPIGPAPLRLA